MGVVFKLLLQFHFCWLCLSPPPTFGDGQKGGFVVGREGHGIALLLAWLVLSGTVGLVFVLFYHVWYIASMGLYLDMH